MLVIPSPMAGKVQRKSAKRRQGWVRRLLLWLTAAAAALLMFFTAVMVLLRWVNPPFTMVQVQQRIHARWAGHAAPSEYRPVPLSSITPDLQHAVIAAEDARFYSHRGIDFKELRNVVEEDLEEGTIGRGASTITQQLVKNLFLTNSRSFLRKGFEFALAPLAELVLPKQRILELYLNVIEWGPGVYGAEAAARYHYGIPASRLSREQAARLAAIVPSPRARRPERMARSSARIQTRMREMGW